MEDGEEDLVKNIPKNVEVKDVEMGSTRREDAQMTPGACQQRLVKRAPSRRTRGGRGIAQTVLLPPPSPVTEKEKEMLDRLEELMDLSGGLKSEEAVFTLVMILKEEKRPVIHAKLMEIVLQSAEGILKKLVASNQFLALMHHWMGIYAKSDAWSDVLKKIFGVFGKLPLKRDDIREAKIPIKKLTHQGLTEDVKQEAQKLLDLWEEKRKDSATVERRSISGSLLRLNSWPKRKVGKAYIAMDPDVKHVKLTRGKSGPLFSSHSAKRQPTAKGPMSPRPSVRMYQKMIHLDSLAPEATKAINQLRLEKQLEAHKEEAPSRLMHSAETAPSGSVFYAQQRALYDELRAEKERQSLQPWELSGSNMETQVQWTEPSYYRMPPGDVIRAPMESTERESQTARERSVPASDSGPLFASSLEETMSGSHETPMIEFSFFPRNQEQRELQREVLKEAGVSLQSVLGPADSDHDPWSPCGAFKSSTSF